MWAPPTRHPGSARMMVASRPRHGFAMMWASPTRHPGSARMMVAKRPRHGFAMINLLIWLNVCYSEDFLRIRLIYGRQKSTCSLINYPSRPHA
jgi:hypothetical protein